MLRLWNELFLSDEVEQNKTSLLNPYNHRVTNTHHHYEIDLPGVKKEELSININKKTHCLEISGKRNNNFEQEQEGEYYVKHTSFGSFNKSFTLSDDINLNTVQAAFNDGVLKITFEKKKKDTKHLINIKIE